jgi:hypothetical protein
MSIVDKSYVNNKSWLAIPFPISRVIQRFWRRQPRSSTSFRVFGKGNPVDFALSADEKTSL